MNKRQRELSRLTLKREKQIIADLKKTYQTALQDITAKIAELTARTDVQNLQSIIYQIEYQKALKDQISAFLDVLHQGNFDTISKYLAECYELGWVGTLYDLQGQGVPLLFRIDQAQVIKAVETNSKLSKNLYESLGIDIKALKQTVREELSRGISQSLSYRDIARNLKNAANISFNNAVRIARTEGHRISQEATFNCQMEAKKRGCEIVKRWDSTLDGRTRRTHQELDGQTVDVEAPYILRKGGREYKAMHPSAFGVASEDINCRCASLQIAKWMLDDEEFTKYDGEERELRHFENIDDYNKFKAEFWKWEGDNK